MTVKLLTIAEYARHRQCDERAVRRALAEGRITRLSSDRRCLDAAVADIQWAKNTRARVRPGLASGAAAAGAVGAGGADARDRRARAEADLAELDALKGAGQLLEVQPAERVVFTAFRELRDVNFAAVRNVAAHVVGLTDVREVEQLLEQALRPGFQHFEQRVPAELATLKGA